MSAENSLRENLSEITRMPLTDKHVSVIVENADRKGITNEESALDFVSAMLEYEINRLPRIREQTN